MINFVSPRGALVVEDLRTLRDTKEDEHGCQGLQKRHFPGSQLAILACSTVSSPFREGRFTHVGFPPTPIPGIYVA